MNSTPQHLTSHLRTNSRWQALSPAEKMQEFQELATSPYWHFLPTEVKIRIQHLVSASSSSSCAGLMPSPPIACDPPSCARTLSPK